MSFTAELKSQLAKEEERKKCCADVLLRGLLLVDGSIHFSSKQVSLETVTENAAVARKVKSALEGRDLSVSLTIRRSNLQKHSNYLVACTGRKLLQFLSGLKITDLNGAPILDIKVPSMKDCCSGAFLRGLFLGGGYVSTPGKGYRLQIYTGNYNLAKETSRFLKEKGLRPALTETKKGFHIDINNRNDIHKFLLWIGSPALMLDFQNVQIIKDLRNYANRLVNSDTANMKKTAIAAMQQIKIIDYIKIKKGFEDLPSSLAEAAYLRLSYPSLSLEQLGKKGSAPISKSAINHRMRRLKLIARELGY